MNLFNLLNGIDPPPGLGENNEGTPSTTFAVILGILLVILIFFVIYAIRNNGFQKEEENTTENSEKTMQKEEKTDVKIYPIICPRCGSKEFVLSNEKNHDAISVCKILNLFIGITIFILFYNSIVKEIKNVKVNNLEGYMFLLLIPYVIIRLIQYNIESKTHVHAICKNCGKTWNVDEVHKQ